MDKNVLKEKLNNFKEEATTASLLALKIIAKCLYVTLHEAGIDAIAYDKAIEEVDNKLYNQYIAPTLDSIEIRQIILESEIHDLKEQCKDVLIDKYQNKIKELEEKVAELAKEKTQVKNGMSKIVEKVFGKK